ncbi:MAG: DUF6580 family putative transport protein [Bacteroidota bacterium]
MLKKIDPKLGVITLLIAVVALSRLFSPLYNFTPITAMALFGGAYFSRKWLAFVIPFAAMWLSDLYLNNVVYAAKYPDYYTSFTWFGDMWVYASFFLIVLLGMGLLQKVSFLRVAGTSLLASVLFFLITNFGAWLSLPMYTKDISGLMQSYAAGIPFFQYTVAGDLFYAFIFFGAFEWMKSRFPQLQLSK